jgi:hypothetical protein
MYICGVGLEDVCMSEVKLDLEAVIDFYSHVIESCGLLVWIVQHG